MSAPGTSGGGPIRVLLLITNLEYGGAQRQAIALANEVDPLQVDLHVGSLSSHAPLAAELRDAPRRLHVVEKRFRYDVTVIPRLVRLLRELKPEILHTYLFDADIAGRLAGPRAGVSCILGTERNAGYRLKTVRRLAYAVTRGRVHGILANSHAGAAFHRGLHGYPEAMYRVVHNGVDVTRFAPRDAGEARRDLGIPEAGPVVGMFASFKVEKNHDLLVDAAAAIVASHPGVRFLLVGDELHRGVHGSREQKAAMVRRIEELGLSGHFLLLGNRADVERIYPACDVTVLPSRFEGTPNVALESMACGVPVVATGVSDNAQIVLDGRTGYIVPLDRRDLFSRRVVELLADAGGRARMAAEARRRTVEEFSNRVMASRTAAIYREMLEVRGE